MFPDFLPWPNFKYRNKLSEKLERLDMLRRRQKINIPEFYVGSILRVTTSDPYAPRRVNTFVGICIQRDEVGLRHYFTLRNYIDGEVKYEMYSPLIQKIEVLKLEKRLDDELLYLRDCPPEYSAVPLNMDPVPCPVGTVPLNTAKVKLKFPPWNKRWELRDVKGIEEFWNLVTPYYKKLFEHHRKYDIVDQYRKSIPLEDLQEIVEDIKEFEKHIKIEPRSRHVPISTLLVAAARKAKHT
ncbi:unnamed protein product [Soboliphyme baturini]|uniref:Large ribosomal subunit protein bL19m n=1 Tax=Soboliphyme baturini TaxID=241478 RepID=A0A183ITZ6_9BILA|nr:unnamed protein product [Soboliphyme baturini]